MKIGFIGCGNMGGAILDGGLNAGVLHKKNIIVSTHSEESNLNVRQKYGVKTSSNKTLVELCDIIFMAVKPNMFDDIIDEIKGKYTEDKIIVSIAAGISISYLKNRFENQQMKIIRVMPNTPAMVGEGMSGICASKEVDKEVFNKVAAIFSGIGKYIRVNENDMDAVTAISGSSPAYAFMFIDAMVKSGMGMGLSEDAAKLLAAQSMLGASKMVLNSELSCEQLKINVCSPGGTTIEAVKVFDDADLYEIVDKAMKACADKSKELTK